MQRSLLVWVPVTAVTCTVLPLVHATYYQGLDDSGTYGMHTTVFAIVIMLLTGSLVCQVGAMREDVHLAHSPLRPALHAGAMVIALVVAIMACLIPRFEGLIFIVATGGMAIGSFYYWAFTPLANSEKSPA